MLRAATSCSSLPTASLPPSTFRSGDTDLYNTSHISSCLALPDWNDRDNVVPYRVLVAAALFTFRYDSIVLQTALVTVTRHFPPSDALATIQGQLSACRVFGRANANMVVVESSVKTAKAESSGKADKADKAPDEKVRTTSHLSVYLPKCPAPVVWAMTMTVLHGVETTI